MARSKAIAKPTAPKGQELATVDAELAAFASNISTHVSAPAGNKIKVLASGHFVLPGGEDIGNQIDIVVVNFVGTNKYYDVPYREGEPTAPACYAVGHKSPMNLTPEPDSPSIQNDNCHSCPMGGVNAFGTHANGKSKACSNRYIAAVRVDDPNDPDAMSDPNGTVYLLEVPPTSLKSFEGAVNGIARSLGGHPVKAILRVTGTPKGTYAAMDFDDPRPNPNYAMHFTQGKAAEEALMRKPDFAAAAAAAPPSRSRAAARPRTPARR